MEKFAFIPLFLIFNSCNPNSQKKDCYGSILNLELNSYNKLIEYYKLNNWISVTDSIQLLKYINPDQNSIFFEELRIDSNKKEHFIKVKEGIIKTKNYQIDLLLIHGSDKNRNIHYWLRSYDLNRNQIGGFHFAGYNSNDSTFYKGRIDCDSIIYQKFNHKNEIKKYRIDINGKIILVKVDQCK